jgi:hypothetical protein
MHTLIRAHGAVAYREALFADETPYAAMEATLPEGSKAEARLDGKGRPIRSQRSALGSMRAWKRWRRQRARVLALRRSEVRIPSAPPTSDQRRYCNHYL